ncbi:pyrophosphatase PpaX [Paenibacillus apiarius]|uniref:Pyrophosphatase PpaX n=1 Tax=Paenibacillus apiarius TaxID=46240 RepID=A0ABT4DRR9_9BACL|nr:pyrophosphatase PpaX [Paenibacillus apiarius]MBN3524457.1 pyrophosphatase PpaX [Paenibacillus apiarius]MCY9515310.1 pyrophosphatase PpaX [Paenibacillus apiarius]MCY9520059.1 pyrophosphatase PpaX [Paenibacillus apiarius]MCY9554318.1 pyrophosphatase PpaX [Paenibacillus apiarius]MCY9558109.1 pyrophosphatase PpaX [Paenibacillus apiarius]
MIQTVLFDLDGTIIDTNELIIQTFLHVLKDKTPSPFARESIIPSMGLPLEHQIRIFTGLEQVDDLVEAYREYNIARHDELVREFPHVTEVIETLHRHGIRLGVVTTKMRLTTERALRMFGLYEQLGTIVTIQDVTQPKPHPEPVLRAIEALQADPATTLMVGDSPADIQSANAAGAISCGVAWSLKGEAVLRQYDPRHIIHDMRDLYALVGLERDEG